MDDIGWKFRAKIRTNVGVYLCHPFFFHSRYWCDWLLIQVYGDKKYAFVKNAEYNFEYF